MTKISMRSVAGNLKAKHTMSHMAVSAVVSVFPKNSTIAKRRQPFNNRLSEALNYLHRLTCYCWLEYWRVRKVLALQQT